MIWKEIKEKDLEKGGWKYILTCGDSLKVFKKELKIIFWNQKTQTIIYESVTKNRSFPFPIITNGANFNF